MSEFGWILVGGLAMSAVAMVGGLTVVLSPRSLERLLLPLIALAAGTLLGGAFFHMIPEALGSLDPREGALWFISGFTLFLALEQFLHWHHSHHETAVSVQPVTYLVLVGDAIHNFLGGLSIASTFLIAPTAGVVAWAAAVAHEIPQELGDFGILVHGGWPRRRALTWNVVSALTFPLGAVLAYAAAVRFELGGLVLFGAGNFVYIAASDLIPEIKAETGRRDTALHFGCYVTGLVLMYLLAHWTLP